MRINCGSKHYEWKYLTFLSKIIVVILVPLIFIWMIPMIIIGLIGVILIAIIEEIFKFTKN